MSTAVVYVVRLRRPLCHARHYVGWTCDLPNRVRQHLTGRGSALLNAANAYGIRWDVVHVIACPSWKVAQELERHIKRSRHVTRWCPVERHRAGRDSVSFAPGRTADTRRPVADALASVPAEVRALTAGPDALTPRAVPFARRDFDPYRAASLAQSGPVAAPFPVLALAA
ncbi:MAG: GIY-YIG nuclease family protein [Rhodothermales bacterium]